MGKDSGVMLISVQLWNDLWALRKVISRTQHGLPKTKSAKLGSEECRRHGWSLRSLTWVIRKECIKQPMGCRKNILGFPYIAIHNVYIYVYTHIYVHTFTHRADKHFWLMKLWDQKVWRPLFWLLLRHLKNQPCGRGGKIRLHETTVAKICVSGPNCLQLNMCFCKRILSIVKISFLSKTSLPFIQFQ